jgi:MFS family permease
MQYGASLDWLNFLLADVRGGLGPYVSVFLLTEAKWDQATIGAVLTVSGIIGIALHTPVGALIDITQRKRALLVGGVVALSLCALSIALAPVLPVVLAADVIMAVLGAVFAPTVAAITLGIVGRDRLAARLGRNAAFDRLGHLTIAAIAGVVGTAFSQRAVFFLVPFFAVLAIIAIGSIPAHAIDHDRARGLDTGRNAWDSHPAHWRVLLSRRPLIVLGVTAALFHFANAPMLALASQKLALSHPGREAALTSAAIIAAQLATIPMAFLVAWADVLGRKPLLIAALLALPLRGLLFAFADQPTWIIAGQILDGFGGGLFDALMPLILADVTRGTGRYNVSRGLISTVQGIGGSLSQAAAGLVVVEAGYQFAFLGLSAFGLSALMLTALAMPETRQRREAPLALRDDL